MNKYKRYYEKNKLNYKEYYKNNKEQIKEYQTLYYTLNKKEKDNKTICSINNNSIILCFD
jgi:hypothetical protein